LDSKPSALPLHHQRLHKAPGARNRAKQVLTKFFLSLSLCAVNSRGLQTVHLQMHEEVEHISSCFNQSNKS
jgi:hypothetical protein